MLLKGKTCNGDGTSTFGWTLNADGVLARDSGSTCPVKVPEGLLSDILAVDPWRPSPTVFLRDGAIWRCRDSDNAGPWKCVGLLSAIWPSQGYRELARVPGAPMAGPTFVAASFIRTPGKAPLVAVTDARLAFAFDSSSGVGQPIAAGQPVPGTTAIVRVGLDPERVVHGGNRCWRVPRVVVLESGAMYGWSENGWARKAA